MNVLRPYFDLVDRVMVHAIHAPKFPSLLSHHSHRHLKLSLSLSVAPSPPLHSSQYCFFTLVSSPSLPCLTPCLKALPPFRSAVLRTALS